MREQLELFGAFAPHPQKKTMGSGKARSSKSTSPSGRKPKDGSGSDGSDGGELDAALHEEARRRYLNYAISVITSRALPDVRDGLKPVHRRILYAMYHEEHLTPEGRYRKSATVVGAVLGKYHPHGDTAVYDSLVRMAQDFAMRAPLVDGQGNFGSLDGDRAAAYRYTECRLQKVAMEFLTELNSNTVDFRPNFDGTVNEPIVLPARVPNLLVNGSTGIAVGMATNIPPHNLGEVCQAAIALVDDSSLSSRALLKYIKGPDFPTGGQILNTKRELGQVYTQGQGAIRVRGEHRVEAGLRGAEIIVITSIPYALNKSTLVEAIADIIRARKLPHLIDIRDESTDTVRVVLEVKRDADISLVMAYLYKHTQLQQNFNVNLTCLVPSSDPGVCTPMRLDLKGILQHFLSFRFDVVTRRLTHRLDELKRRIHILDGFAKIFKALDEAIRIIRRSDGKKDAAKKLIARFRLDAVQTEAILELKLYKIAKLEIRAIMDEHAEKKAEAKQIEALLKSDKKRWAMVKGELDEVSKAYGDKRRSKLGGAVDETEYTAESFIVAEDAKVVVTRDGWIKRVRELKDPSQTRVREGDEVMAVLSGSTKESVVFFSSHGYAYVARINDIPATTGYGDPVQKLFRFKDGERVVAALSLDPRASRPEVMLAISKRGYGLRFVLEPHAETSTRAGRRYARPSKDEIVGVYACEPSDIVCVATESGHVLSCKAKEIKQLTNPGRGVTVIKVGADDSVIAAGVSHAKKDVVITIESAGGKRFEITAGSYKTVARAGKGHQVAKRTRFKVIPPPVTVTEFTPEDVN